MSAQAVGGGSALQQCRIGAVRMASQPPVPIRLTGIYDADGGVAGELAYVFRVATGRKGCSLCKITHSFAEFGEKRKFDEASREYFVRKQFGHSEVFSGK